MSICTIYRHCFSNNPFSYLSILLFFFCIQQHFIYIPLRDTPILRHLLHGLFPIHSAGFIAVSYTHLSQENLDNQIGQILSAIEPTLVIALSLIVGVILLSVMFPLMGIMSGI